MTEETLRLSEYDQENAAALEAAHGRGMRVQMRRTLLLGAACIIVMFLGVILPTYAFLPSRWTEMSLPVFMDETARNLNGLLLALAGNGSLGSKPCMYLVAAVSGGALGMCGSVYQGALRNPLAAPKTLGVMSGGALGALVYLLFLQNVGPVFVPEDPFAYSQAEYEAWLSQLPHEDPLGYVWLLYGKCLCSVAGCFVIVAVVLFIAAVVGHGKLSNITLIVGGQIFAVGITALITFCRYYFTQNGNDELALEMMQIENYALGGSFFLQDVIIICVPLLAMMTVVFLMRNKLTMLSFGDAEGQSMGVNVNRTRYAMVAICTAMTGWAISFAGHVAFLGFISAHTARKIVGPEMRYLLPASVFVGGTFLSLFYLLTTMGLPFAPVGSVGMYTSIVGAGVFLLLALRQRGTGSGDWT